MQPGTVVYPNISMLKPHKKIEYKGKIGLVIGDDTKGIRMKGQFISVWVHWSGDIYAKREPKSYLIEVKE